jgi:hypothetical protein
VVGEAKDEAAAASRAKRKKKRWGRDTHRNPSSQPSSRWISSRFKAASKSSATGGPGAIAGADKECRPG